LWIFVGVDAYEDCLLLVLPDFYLTNEIVCELGSRIRILLALLVEKSVLLVEGVVGAHVNLLVFAYSVS